MGKLRQKVTISDSPKSTVRQEQKRGQKAAPPIPREVLAPLVSASQPLPVALSPPRVGHRGELNKATEAVPTLGSQISAQAAKLTPSPFQAPRSLAGVI